MTDKQLAEIKERVTELMVATRNNSWSLTDNLINDSFKLLSEVDRLHKALEDTQKALQWGDPENAIIRAFEIIHEALEPALNLPGEVDQMNQRMSREEETFEEFLERMIAEGYMDGNCRPLKCHYCGSTDVEERNHMYEDFSFVVEYQMFCKSCNVSIGQWSYGHWEV